MSPAVYRGAIQHRADTCEPLKQAAAKGAVKLQAWGHGSYPGRQMSRGMLAGLSSVGLWDARVPQSWGLNWHYNEGIELTYVLRGKVPFSVDGESYLLRQGQMTITRPWQRHRVGDPHIPPSSLVWFILDVGVRRPNQSWKWPAWLLFSDSDIQKLTRLLRQNEEPYWDVGRGVRERFRVLAATLQNEDPEESSTRIAVCINDLLLELFDHLSDRGISQDPELCSGSRATALFLERLQEECRQPWSLQGMAEACGFGRTQFSRNCKEITNMTPMEYLRSCRIEMAKRELKANRTSSITDVAFACGFSSSQYFATVFRGATGLSPTEYRRQRL